MPNRLIRDGLLDSEAVLSLPVEARWLYVSILLSADDVGLFEATPFRLARRADLRRDHAERLVQHLVDADLIRLYTADGKAFGFIPRFGQRLQIKRARCPLPSVALLNDDEDAVNKIKHLASNPTVSHGDPPESTVVQPPEPEPEPEKKKEIHAPSAPSRKRSAIVSEQEIVAEGVVAQHAADWLSARKAKRLPLTVTAWAETKAEALKAGIGIHEAIRIAAGQGWGGFKASWLKKDVAKDDIYAGAK